MYINVQLGAFTGLLYLIIILTNGLLSFYFPYSSLGLTFTVLVYGLLVTASPTAKALASVLTVARINTIWDFPFRLSSYGLSIVYLLIFLILVVIQRVFVSILDTFTFVCDVFGIQIPEQTRIYTRKIHWDRAYFCWPKPKNYFISKFLIEMNGVLVGECSPLEEFIGFTGLKPDTIYRLRIWAVSYSRGTAPSKYFAFKTLKPPLPLTEANSSTQIPYSGLNKNFTLQDRIANLKDELEELQASRAKLRTEERCLSTHEILKDVQSELKQAEFSQAEFEKRVNDLRLQLELIQNERHGTEDKKRAIEKEFEAISKVNRKLDNELNSHTQELKSAQTQLKTQNQKIQCLKEKNSKDVTSNEQQKTSLKEELTKVKKQHGQASKELENESSILNNYENELSKLTEKCEKFEQDVEQYGSYENLRLHRQLSQEFTDLKAHEEDLTQQLQNTNRQKLSILHNLADSRRKTAPSKTQLNKYKKASSNSSSTPILPTFDPENETEAEQAQPSPNRILRAFNWKTAFPKPNKEKKVEEPQLKSFTWNPFGQRVFNPPSINNEELIRSTSPSIISLLDNHDILPNGESNNKPHEISSEDSSRHSSPKTILAMHLGNDTQTLFNHPSALPNRSEAPSLPFFQLPHHELLHSETLTDKN
jgi:predicted  nucleic acid-binding Zn-ribbon protein